MRTIHSHAIHSHAIHTTTLHPQSPCPSDGRSEIGVEECSQLRVAAMFTAIELEVDRDDFSFRSEGERHLWDELEAEYAELVEREGSVWTAD